MSIRQKFAVAAFVIACLMEMMRLALTAKFGDAHWVEAGVTSILAYVPNRALEAQPWEATGWTLAKWCLVIGGILAFVPTDRWGWLQIAARLRRRPLRNARQVSAPPQQSCHQPPNRSGGR